MPSNVIKDSALFRLSALAYILNHDCFVKLQKKAEMKSRALLFNKFYVGFFGLDKINAGT